MKSSSKATRKTFIVPVLHGFYIESSFWLSKFKSCLTSNLLESFDLSEEFSVKATRIYSPGSSSRKTGSLFMVPLFPIDRAFFHPSYFSSKLTSSLFPINVFEDYRFQRPLKNLFFSSSQKQKKKLSQKPF